MRVCTQITVIAYASWACSTIHSCAVIYADIDRDILSTIASLKHRVADIMEPDYGLLDELLRLDVLNRREYDDVCSERGAAYRRSEAILDLLTEEQQCDKFLETLRRTHQPHVANYITQNGGQKCYWHCRGETVHYKQI